MKSRQHDYERIIVGMLRNDAGIVRSEISRRLGVSKSTVERAVNRLTHKGVLSESTASGGRKGRGGVKLSINPNGPYVIGVELDAFSLQAAGINLNGDVLLRSRTDITLSMTREDILAQIDKLVAALIKTMRAQGRGLLGIGYGDLGLVDSVSGMALHSANLPQWREVPLVSRLEKRFSVPVLLQQSSRVKCLAEARYGVAKGVQGFLFIDLDIGVGLGVYSNGRLYSGEQGRGCEFGHMIVEPNGPVCGCGGKGCLEALVGSRAITRQAQDAIRQGAKTAIFDLAGRQLESVTVQHVFTAAEQKDRLALTLLETAATILGRAIGNICNLFNPRLIVLGGGMANAPHLWLPMEDVIRKTALPFVAQQIDRVQVSGLLDEGGVLGASELVIQQMLSDTKSWPFS